MNEPSNQPSSREEKMKKFEESMLRSQFPDLFPRESKYPEGSFEAFYEKKKIEAEDAPKMFEEEQIPKSILWEEFNLKIFEEKSWRIKDLIPKQGAVILASVSGNRKTWVSMEMAKAIASGTDFLGEEVFKTEGANVLYLNAENAESEMQRRGRQLGVGSPSGTHKLHLINADNINLNEEDGTIWIKAFIEFHKIEVVFIDTFIAVAGGLKEEKSEEIRQFFNRFNCLKNMGVVVIWLMHMRKPTNFEGNKAPRKEQLLGSQDKASSVEILLMLHSEAGGDEIKVYQRKNRLSVEISPFKISIRDRVGVNNQKMTILGYEGPLEEEENKKEQAKDLILEIMGDEGRTTNEILEITKKQVGSKNTRNALNELVRDKLLQLEKKGKQNFYILPKEEDVEKLDLDVS